MLRHASFPLASHRDIDLAAFFSETSARYAASSFPMTNGCPFITEINLLLYTPLKF